jgi:hypothetical protein
VGGWCSVTVVRSAARRAMELGHLQRKGATSGNLHPEGEGGVSPLGQGFNQVETLGTGDPKRRALNWRQIERPNKVIGVNGLIVARLNYNSDFCAEIHLAASLAP